MGQEAICTVWFDGKASEGKALLETNELIFRGDFRLVIPLSEVRSAEATDGRLQVAFPGGEATLDLGPKAGKWAERILNPKSLIDKLGVTSDSRVSVIGVADEPFLEQLRARTGDVSLAGPASDSDLIFFGAETKADLAALESLQQYLKRNGAIWVVSPKGKPHLKDTDVMAAGKAAGLVDTKVAGFSKTHTATKLVIPVARR